MQRSALSQKIKSLILLTTLVSGGKVLACEIEEKTISSSTIFVAKDLQAWGFDSNSKSDVLTLSKCGSSVQLALGVNLPSPADFSTETWLKSSATPQRRCELTSELSHVRSGFHFNSNDLRTTVQMASDCMGLQVSDETGAAITLEDSLNCHVVQTTNQKSVLTLQGDNCVVRPNSTKSRLRIMPLYLGKSCASSAVVRSAGVMDIDLSLNVISVGGESQAEALGNKNIKLVFANQGQKVRNSNQKPKNFQVPKSSSYALGFDLADLRLSGSKDTGLVAGAQFYVSQQTEAHLPFVVRSTIMLIKKNGYESLPLGSWYSGSIIPPHWQGLDGLSDLHSIAVTQENFNLNKSVRLIEKGDRLMVTARLESPNSGPQRFWKYAQGLLKRPAVSQTSQVHTVGSNGIEAIKPLDGLTELSELQEIPELESLGSTTRQMLQVFSLKWPVIFDSFCNESRTVCRPMEELDELAEVRALYEVEDADFEIKVKPVKYAKTSAVEKELVTPMNGKTEIKCY